MSGLIIKEYCQKNDISKNAYFYWLRKIRKATLANSGLDFVALPCPTGPACAGISSFDTEAVISASGAEISINSHTPKELLARILLHT